MTVSKSEIIAITDESDVVFVRQKARAWAVELRFSILDQTKILTAASELGRNTLVHGKGGRAHFEVLDENGRHGLRIKFEDEGPGIADMKLAMMDGYTSSGGLGLGLSGSKRLVNDFEIKSEPGKGTTVTITRWI